MDFGLTKGLNSRNYPKIDAKVYVRVALGR